MLPEDKYFQTLTEDELWQRYCGFLDLSVDEFVEIQTELLMDEIDRVADSMLGKKIMGNRKPKSVEEFRRMVPLTTYEDYEPYLSEKHDDVLAEKPLLWCHSTGRGGKFKWVPYFTRALDVACCHFIASFIFACAKRKGEVIPRPGYRLLTLLPPPPYASGALMNYLATQRFSINLIPPIVDTQITDFQERIAHGFQLALRNGVDEIGAISSVLVKIGESMTGQAQRTKFSLSMLHPSMLLRLVRAYLSSRIARRAILPRDLWHPKSVSAGGTDSTIYKKDVAYYWGQVPHEIYGSTEATVIAMQAWNKKWLTFFPDVAFWEFIPEAERLKEKEDKQYQPVTVLLNELEPGKDYELILTQFYGMPLLRYRIKDLVSVAAVKDEEAGINLPQITFKARLGDMINLAGLAELDEKTVWQAIVDTGIRFEDWSARKEYDQGQTYLRLYVELKEDRQVSEVEQMVDRQLKATDVDYRDLGDQLGLQPVRVTLLSPRTFQRYYEEKHKEGADLAHLKPPHMNATDTIIDRLLQLSQEAQKEP